MIRGTRPDERWGEWRGRILRHREKTASGCRAGEGAQRFNAQPCAHPGTRRGQVGFGGFSDIETTGVSGESGPPVPETVVQVSNLPVNFFGVRNSGLNELHHRVVVEAHGLRECPLSKSAKFSSQCLRIDLQKAVDDGGSVTVFLGGAEFSNEITDWVIAD